MTTLEAEPNAADESVTIRPIRPADVSMEGEFIRNLSTETKHFRFLCGVKELPPAELKRLCEVDGRHSMAFVATVKRNGHEMEVGVSRYATSCDDSTGELAVTIADAWQHKGIAAQLVKCLIAYAGAHGIKQLYAMELLDNISMRRLADELGMSVRPDPDDAKQVIYRLSV